MTALRSFLFAAWLYVGVAVVGLAYLPAAMVSVSAARAAPRAWARMTLWGLRWIGGVTLEIRGREHIPTGAALIAAKHHAMLDTIVPFLLLRDVAMVFKKELLDAPVYGLFAARGGHVPVDREAHAAALKAMLKAAGRAAAEGRQIMIFPEGTRTLPADPPSYKPGVAALYRSLNLPCTPVALNTGLAWTPKGVTITPGRVVMEFLPPIPPGLSREEFMTRLESAIEEASQALLPPERRRAKPLADEAREPTPMIQPEGLPP